MKYITITGGLGNQMFIHAFCLSLRNKGKKAVLFVPRKTESKGYGHQGYELEKLFQTKRFDGRFSVLCNSFVQLYSQFIRLFPRKWKPRLFNLIGIHIVSVSENFIYYQEVFDFKHKHEMFMGTWQSELFFKDAKDIVRREFAFNEELLSEMTIETRKHVIELNSVSIHIRRGDYLSNQYSNGFAGVCTNIYYENAIKFIKEKVEYPQFYVFTDDKEWVREHFEMNGAIYINFNNGKDSWQDMYLMSQCKHNIIANSSFSWWGAWLNNNPDKIVVAPKLWWRLFEKDDVVPGDWIRI